MKSRRAIPLTALLAAGGLAGLIWVSQGQDETAEITILAPKKPALAPAGTATSAAAPASVSVLPTADAASALPGTVPVGGVVAWMKSGTNTPALPPEWAECNGQVLARPGSPYNGQTLPDLNGAAGSDKRFLRGSTQSGATGGAESHNHGFILIERPAKRTINVASKEPGSNLPPFYEVTWIMRVL